MFRIDKELISYASIGASKDVYTNIGDNLRVKKLQSRAEELEKTAAEIQRMTENAKKQAEEILSDAKEKARILMEKSHAEAKVIFEEARKAGFDEGAQKAEKEGQERCRREIDGIRNVLEEICSSREAMIDETEDDIIDLVFDISKKVINVQMEKDDKTFIELVRNALGKLKREGKLVVRVSPDEYHRIFSSGKVELTANKEVLFAEVAEEPYFNRWDCVVESEGETLNAGVDSQLKCIELAFRRKESGGL
ncbi:MAG: FliH/SctL family protein [Oscillospiraceae bacterium]